MSSLPLLNDEQWLKLLAYVAEAFNEVTLSRGFTYFKQQRVTTLIVSEHRVIEARLEESEDYLITLPIDELGAGFCTCPVHTSCKHLAAVIMELGDRLGYPASQIMNAKQHLKRTFSSSASEPVLFELPNKDAVGWQQFLEHFTSPVKPTYDLATYIDLLRYHLKQIEKVSIPFSEIDRIYFDLHQELFILRKIKEQKEQSSVSYYTSSALYRVYDQIHEWLKQKAVSSLISSNRLEQTLGYLREQMAVESVQRYQDYELYRILWKYWITPYLADDHLLSQEMNNVEKRIEETPSSSLSAAKAYLFLLQSKSREAWEALEASNALKEAPIALFISFLDHLRSTHNWDHLVYWLRVTAPFFYGKRTNELDAYARYWKETITHLPETEGYMWGILEEMLPHSYRIIEGFQYEQRNWQRWLEMQILQGHDPLSHRVSVLQPIEKESPQLLLPYYHQAVDHYVRLKNRHDYKSAVRLLKRLEKVYKKMKQDKRWESFFAGFVERHSRLRALQEELRKGKLLQ
ncbi:SWIM zinc finger domain-containing protein [Paenibacillus sp. N3.4]|uniref:SWIM zinc finger family protein n=1 Tax=Paenibacillus sp. N3.4 TaxID=2603222 RepID=UPI0011CAB31E|nr:hypothetical protein [Paenibacillus sp. N3.4]TXK85063.1 hypothetical protein FU659_06100 [Paenibacillus sp. N3.4]